MRPDRIGLGIALALHALAAVALLSHEPARKALLAAAPIMVDLIVPPKADVPRPQPTELPRSIAKPVERPIAAPLLAAPADPATPTATPATPAPVQAVAPTVPPVALMQPVFNADYLDNPAPAYPAMSRRLGEQGRVILRVLVNAGGTADEVQVRTSSGHVRLDDTACETVRRWRFVPAKRGAEPVAAWVLIPISFRLEG